MAKLFVGVTRCKSCNRKMARVFEKKIGSIKIYSFDCKGCGGYGLTKYDPKEDTPFRNPLALLFNKNMFRKHPRQFSSAQLENSVNYKTKIIITPLTILKGFVIGFDVLVELSDGVYRFPEYLIDKENRINMGSHRVDGMRYSDKEIASWKILPQK